MKPVIIILALLSSPMAIAAQQVVTVEAGSQIWVEGTSSVNAFTCQTALVDGWGEFRGEDPLSTRGQRAELGVQVASLDCGQRRLTRDMLETLEADRHPEIHFELMDAGPDASLQSDTAARTEPTAVEAKGLLTIAGQSRQVQVEGRLVLADEGSYRLQGSKRLLLTDFGIEPPTKLFGLIKVNNEIDVRFDLIASRRGSVPSTDHP